MRIGYLIYVDNLWYWGDFKFLVVIIKVLKFFGINYLLWKKKIIMKKGVLVKFVIMNKKNIDF